LPKDKQYHKTKLKKMMSGVFYLFFGGLDLSIFFAIILRIKAINTQKNGTKK
jgi:hypothetical protein